MNQIKQGYKQTKVGIIPKDWEVVKLGELSNKIGSGITPKGGEEVYQNSGRFFIRSQNIGMGSLLLNDVAYISEEIHSTFKNTEIKQNDVLLNITGASIGRCAIANKKIEGGNVNQHVCIIRPKSNRLDSRYLATFLLSYQGQKQIDSFQAGGNREGLNFAQIASLLTQLPPLKEQEKIAEILTTWDEAITKQTQLLEAKELQKKALMQKLLSGEVRFDGFSDEWEEVRLGEIGNSFNGLSGKTGEDFGIGEAKYITYKNIFDYSKIKLDIFENVQISNDEKQNLVQFGDIFFTVSSETPEEVGMSSVLLDNVFNTYLNSFCFGYRLNNFNTLDPYFARFYFRSFQMRDKISRLAQGSTRFNLSKNEIMKLKIKLPSLPEQQKIAEVLSLADDEINLLKNELEELKLQKKALMQKLLTGQVRLKA